MSNRPEPADPPPHVLDIDLTEFEKLRIAQLETDGPIEDEELERFRDQWRHEVQAKRQEGASSVPGQRKGSERPPDPTGRAGITTVKAESPVRSTRRLSIHRDETPGAGAPKPSDVLPVQKHPRLPARVVEAKEQAVQLYARAVEKEQSSQLSEALMLYRKAFKLDDDVDRSYTKYIAKASAQDASSVQSGPPAPSSSDVVSAVAPPDEPYSFQRHIQLQPDYEKALPPSVSTTVFTRPSPLTALLTSLPIPPSHTDFLPANEDLPIPLARLPPELLDPIFLHLDITSLERFGLTCWRARYLTAISDVWKRIAFGIYKGPAMVPDGWNVRDMARKHKGEWRTTVVEEERVRMDGCYISVCHYTRPGAGDQWVTITHTITYHRFLRFYPDGSVISFLTTEHPSEVVPILRRSIRGKGLHFGRWRLLRSDRETEHFSEKRRAQIEITELLEPGAETPKYEFEMELALRETGCGRWNKLDMSSYSSINSATGESLGLSLKHQKPFYFSKVKSYNPPL